MNSNYCKGQTLIEVLIALGIAVIVMTAATVAVITALSNAQYSKLQNQATQYAQQGMEIMQSYRDAHSLATFSGAAQCIPAACSPASDFASCFPGGACTTLIDNNFTRTVTMSTVGACGGNTKLVTIDVSWTDGKCGSGTDCHHVTVASCMASSFRASL